MLQYLVILLDDTSVSYCHCDNPYKERRLIALDDLRRGIRYAMTENLMVQLVYPDYELPAEYLEVIDTIDHHNIVPYSTSLRTPADVVVIDGLPMLKQATDEIKQPDGTANTPYVLRLRKEELFENTPLVGEMAKRVARLNVVITDQETITDAELPRYAAALDTLAEVVKAEYLAGRAPQLNLLTDRMMLSAMNNCNAGVENLMLAPNGRFYLCPAFYYENAEESVGTLAEGPDIRNAQLLRLDHAPLCRHCDAWHCRRCVWLNRKTTLELNTPSHEQCATAHTEREAARRLLAAIREHGTFLPETEIKELPYLDPFDVRREW